MAAKPHVLIFPYPAQGHMLPLLDLAHHLSSTHNLCITVVVTTKNLPLLSPLLARSPSITPLVLPFPSHPSIPPGVENNQHLPPSSFVPMMHALAALHHPLLLWARSHPSPPTCIISDMFLGWTNDLAADLAVPRLVFSPSGALAIASVNYLWLNMPSPAASIAFSSLPSSPVYPWPHISPIYRGYKKGDPVWEFIKSSMLNNLLSSGYVFNTFEELEGRYLDHMKASLGHSRVWAVGPLSQPSATAAERGGAHSVPAAEVLAWLDKFEEGTVLYVSFGSQAVLAQPQAAALAAALDRSGVRFVWSVKGGGGGVPEGFEERVAERGLVIKGWAPQVAVLGHGAVGWFLTHCGWNSTLEAVAAGVAMLTWPMTADQFLNARLMEEEAGVGVRVCEGADAVPDVEEMARVVAEAVGGEREERKRAAEMRRKAAEAVEEGGSSYRNMEELVEMLSDPESRIVGVLFVLPDSYVDTENKDYGELKLEFYQLGEQCRISPQGSQ